MMGRAINFRTSTMRARGAEHEARYCRQAGDTRSQRAEAKQLRKQARRAHRNNEAELLTKYISFTNYCIYECYKEDAEDWLDSLPEQY